MGTTTGEENLILVLAATIKMPISATPSTQLLDGLKITKAIRRQRNSRHHFHSSTSPTPAGQKLLAKLANALDATLNIALDFADAEVSFNAHHIDAA